MRRRFFCSKFIMFISLTMIPICVLGVMSIFFINQQVKREAEKNSLSITELMKQTMGELITTLEFYRVSVSSNTKINLALIQALNKDSQGVEDLSDLNSAMQSLYYLQNTKEYIHSVYFTMQGSHYYINGIYRESFSDSSDNEWALEAQKREEPSFFQVREIKKNKFDTKTYPMVTIYQKMQYNKLMAINIEQEYFNKWLDSITDYENQILAVMDSQGTVLFYNKNKELLEGKPELLEGYYVNQGEIPGNYGFTYISIIPQSEIFQLSNAILKLTIAGIFFSILLSSFLAYYYTVRDYRQIHQIINLFEQAEKGEIQPYCTVKKANDAYFHIINNIINLFMSQTYLKVQLNAKKYALTTAQLSALQYQLNPHFLFNILQSIDLEILKAAKKPVAANRMISSLSDLLRYSLEDPMKRVSLEKEMIATKCYIELQTCRLGENFSVVWKYEEEVMDRHIIRLLLQPIIENSISHSKRSSLEELKIKIKMWIENEKIKIRIADNGLGMEKEHLSALRKSIEDDQVEPSGKHIGLKNISQRVRLAYRTGYLKIWSKKNMGTIVEIGGIEEEID